MSSLLQRYRTEGEGAGVGGVAACQGAVPHAGEYFWLAEQVTGTEAAVLAKAA